MRLRLGLFAAALLALGIGGVAIIAVFGSIFGWNPFDRSGSTQPDPSLAAELEQEPAPTDPDESGAGEPGISDESVLFGQSAAFSGPAKDLGTNIRVGIEAAFDEANRRGGVHGRPLDLLSLDDFYEPEAAIANTQRLIEEGVFALIGAVGTPTSRSAAPIAAEADVPYIAPFTGAEFLRDPKWDNIINMRASYYQETEEMVARLIGDLGIERIAVIYQDDSFGRAGYRGVLLALSRRNMEPVSTGFYPRNTTAVKTALLDVHEGEAPEAVIIIGAYNPVASLVSWTRHIGLDPVFMTVSFVGSNALAEELGEDGAGVFVTQVVPFPTDKSQSIVSAYHEALSAYAPGTIPGFTSFEGYLAGRLAIAGVEVCGRGVDRRCFLEGMRSSEVISIDGFELSYGQDDNQGSDTVFLTVIGSDGRYHPIETLTEANRWVSN